MSMKDTLCVACKKNHQPDPEMEWICDACWDILNAYDFLVWTKQAEKKKIKVDKKRKKDSLKLIVIHNEHLRKMLTEYRPGQTIEKFSA